MEELNAEIVQKYRLAGKIARQAIEYGVQLIRENQNVFEVVSKIEKFIIDSGAEPAFPVNVSRNDEAAHYTPSYLDSRTFEYGDLIKLDLGVHIDGHIADTAVTVEVGSNQYSDLINASKKALEKVMQKIEIGMTLSEIGAIVEETINFYGFQPIRNLSGHELNRYKLHAGLTVPNYNDKNKNIIKIGMALAIEPFATDGVGFIKEHIPGNIAILMDQEKGRMDRNYELISSKFDHLPFAERWLHSYMSNFERVVQDLSKQKLLYRFPILKEKKKGLVSQAEHTFLVTSDGIITATK